MTIWNRFAILKLPSTEIMPSAAPPYKVKLIFNLLPFTTITMEPFLAIGNMVFAYVHGKLVKLTDMSRSAGEEGFWDISSGAKDSWQLYVDSIEMVIYNWP